MLTEKQIDNLMALLNTNSPSGNEWQINKYIKERLCGKCEIFSDVLGNTYMRTGKPNGIKIMISGHCDEVAFQVTSVNENGFVTFRKVASPDRQTIPGSKVILSNAENNVVGVIGKKPPHITLPEDMKNVLDTNQLWIDFGFSSDKDAYRYVNVGDYIVPYSTPMLTINRKRVVSKALDNKISVFVITELMDELSTEDLPIEVYGVATTQEEVGCRGAQVAAKRVSPDIAFCLDVGVASDTPQVSNLSECGVLGLGKGAIICRNPENNPILVSRILSTAQRNNIKTQMHVGYKPVRGTETGFIQLANKGVASANINIPIRYMHSPIEMCDIEDVKSTIRLMHSIIWELSNCSGSDFELW